MSHSHDTGLNAFGSPNYRRPRRTMRATTCPVPPALATAKFTPPCSGCNYPMLKGETACPRCGKGRAA